MSRMTPRQLDLYLQFMPVAAVPVVQESRRPKDSLNTITLRQLMKTLPKDKEGKLDTEKMTLKQRNLYEKFMPLPAVPQQSLNSVNLDVSNSLEINFPAISPPSVPASQEDSKAVRRKFKRCQSRCVHQFCLPIESQAEYIDCQDRCKQFCS